MQAVQHYAFYVAAFVLALGALVAFHEFGHFWVARRMGVKVLKFSIGFGPKLVGRQIGETEYLLSAIPLGGYVKMLGEDTGEDISETDKKRSFSHAPLYKRFAIVAAGPVFNILLAYLIYTAWLAFGHALPIPSFTDLNATVQSVSTGSPAQSAGIRTGDKIIQIGEKRIAAWNQMSEVFKRTAGKPIAVVIERDGRLETLMVTPADHKHKLAEGIEIDIGQIGISKTDKTVVLKSENPLFAPLDGLYVTWGITKLTVEGFVKMVTREISPDNIGGPLTIAKISGDAAVQGFSNYILLIALLSINLGVLNLLPVPVLDGGHLAFFTLEAILRRPVSIRSREVAQQIGIFLLVCLMLYAFKNDILNVWPK
ncbi:MAG TPA: RIP metalloprotease RseP [Nitrospirales bacterium]|jgi:regulator of sigma E protease